MNWTVVIPCRNEAAVLSEAIISVVAGTVPAHIVVVLDDCSDESEDVARGAVQQLEGYPISILVSDYEMRRGAARNAGIRHAPSPHILCLDAKDKIGPWYLEEATQHLATSDVAAVDSLVFGGDRDVWRASDLATADYLRAKNPMTSAWAFRYDLWERLSGYSEQKYLAGYEDWDFWCRAADSGATIKRLGGLHLFHRA